MKTYYAASTGGFYIESFHAPAQIPKDAVELEGGDAERLLLLAGMGENKRIVAGEKGYPVLEENPAPSDDELAEVVRAERDRKLRESDWSQLADIPAATKEVWAQYRQSLRDLTAHPEFPHIVEWPAQPATD